MWISKKKLAERDKQARHDSFLESLKAEQSQRQWEDIDKLKQDVKKLKKIVRKGY